MNHSSVQPCAQPLVSDWHRLGAGLRVQFSARADRLEAEWRPRLPTRREQRRFIDRYRRARDAFLAAYAAKTGCDATVVVEAAP